MGKDKREEQGKVGGRGRPGSGKRRKDKRGRSEEDVTKEAGGKGSRRKRGKAKGRKQVGKRDR